MVESRISTSARVADNTRPEINEMIQRRTEANVAYFARHPEEIDERLEQLDLEWDIERTLEMNMSAITLGSLLLGTVFRPLRIVPFITSAALLQHAWQGWCPPLGIFRRMGVRTAAEINAERVALQSLRGDFRDLELDQSQEQPHALATRALRAAQQ